MLEFLQTVLQARSEPAKQLTIERRVLITPRSTLNIASIASVSLENIGQRRRLVWNAALLLLAVALAALIAGSSQSNGLVMMFGGVAVLGGLALVHFSTGREVPVLSIASDGGQVFLFTGQRKTLEEARRLLSDKINAGNEDAVYRIHFDKGLIQALGHAEPAAAFGEPGALPFPAPPGPPFGGNGHIATFDAHGLNGSAGNGHHTNGHYANTPHATGSSFHIDYAMVLPQIVDMQRFYAQRQDTLDIAERLNELEFLMRSGTPTAASRSRVGHLVGELSSILGAYPAVVQIFKQAGRLAGY